MSESVKMRPWGDFSMREGGMKEGRDERSTNSLILAVSDHCNQTCFYLTLCSGTQKMCLLGTLVSWWLLICDAWPGLCTFPQVSLLERCSAMCSDWIICCMIRLIGFDMNKASRQSASDSVAACGVS